MYACMQELHYVDRQVGFWSQHFFADQTMTNLHMWTFTCKVCKLGHFVKATHHSIERQHNFLAVFRSILPFSSTEWPFLQCYKAKNMCSWLLHVNLFFPGSDTYVKPQVRNGFPFQNFLSRGIPADTFRISRLHALSYQYVCAICTGCWYAAIYYVHIFAQ